MINKVSENILAMFLKKDTGLNKGQSNEFNLWKALIIFVLIHSNFSSDFKSFIFFDYIDLPYVSVIQLYAFLYSLFFFSNVWRIGGKWRISTGHQGSIGINFSFSELWWVSKVKFSWWHFLLNLLKMLKLLQIFFSWISRFWFFKTNDHFQVILVNLFLDCTFGVAVQALGVLVTAAVIFWVPRTFDNLLYLMSEDFVFQINLNISAVFQILPFVFVDFNRIEFGFVPVNWSHVSEIALMTSHL